MTPLEVPIRFKAILDEYAGRTHSDNGQVMKCLAHILTLHEQMVRLQVEQEAQGDRDRRRHRP